MKILVESEELSKILDVLEQAWQYLISIDTARTVLNQHVGPMKVSPLTRACDKQLEVLVKILSVVPTDEI